MKVSRIVRRTLMVFAILAFVVPAVLLVCGVLPYRVYVIRTGSMSPTIPSKSAVVVREGSYRLGQVISYQTPNGVVTHRLVKRQADGTLGTKGDANRTADPSSIRPADIIGGVVAAPRMAGYWIVYFKNPAGLASLFLAVICAWLLYSLPADFARLKQKQKGRSDRVITAKPIGPRTVQTPRGTSSAAVRASALEGEPVILQCSRCGAAFRTGEELKAHFADYARPKDQSPSLRSASLTIPAKYVPRSLWQKAT